MQRIPCLASRRELAVGSAGLCAWRGGLVPSQKPAWTQRMEVCVRPARPLSVQGRRRTVFAGQKFRLFGSQPRGGEGAPGEQPRGQPGGQPVEQPAGQPGEQPGRQPGRQPAISVVGIPDPITWIRCRVMIFLIDLYFEIEINSPEFEKGVKQALVHVSTMMSKGSYHRLVGIVSKEMIEYVEERCTSLTDAQRQKLAVKMDDIIFVLPEDVSVVFDTHGRKFCFLTMRFWLLTSHEGPDDPEGTRIFSVASSEDGGSQKKIVTAVYEFQRELTKGACPDWTVTTIWHWHWKTAD